MTNSTSYFQRKSLFTALIAVVCLLAGLAVFAATIGWRLLENISDSQHQLSRQDMPLVKNAHSLAAQSTAVALLASQLLGIHSRERLVAFYQTLDVHLKLMSAIPERMSQVVNSQSEDVEISSVVADIRRLFADIQPIIERRLKVQSEKDAAAKRFRVEIAEVQNIVEQEIADQSDFIFQQSEALAKLAGAPIDQPVLDQFIASNLDSEVLFSLSQGAGKLEILIDLIELNPNPTELGRIKLRMAHQLRSMVSDSVSLSSQRLDQSLGLELDQFFKLLVQPRNIATLQSGLNSINLELQEKFNTLQDDIYRLNQLTEALVQRVDSKARINFLEADYAANLGARVLLAIAIVSLIVSIIAIWLFVIRRIVNPLRELALAMRNLSNGQREIEIRSYSMIELNEIAFALEVFRDNSLSLDQYQKTLEEKNTLLSRVNSDLNIFVHVASHDLKSPLNGIKMLASFVSQDLLEGNLKDAGDSLNSVQQRIVRIEHLIESLVEFSRADSAPKNSTDVDITKLLQDTFDLVLSDKKFKLKIPQSIPICNIIESDLAQVFMILFNNAIDHHDRDAGQVEIRFNQIEGFYIFEVIDDGPGIAAVFHKLIFEVLKTLQSRDVVEGSGVGLAHIKRLLESRGGSIAVVSNPDIGRGARFIVRYPIPAMDESEGKLC